MNVKECAVSKDEKLWMSRIADFGCIVCFNEKRGYVPASVHHILRNGKRIDHFHTIPLCPTHHQTGVNTPLFVSRHPWKREFENRYGSESELLEQITRHMNA